MCLKFFDRLFCRFLLRFLSRFFAGSFSASVQVPFSGSFSETMCLAAMKAALASANRRQRNTILPATDENSELIIKSSYRSFCKAFTSSTLTNIPIVLLKTLKKFFIKLSYRRLHIVCKISPHLCLRGVSFGHVAAGCRVPLCICPWKQA